MNVCRRYFGHTCRPFALTVVGQKFYVLTDPGDVSKAYKNTTAFSFEIFAEQLMRTCGCSASSVKKMFQVPPSDGTSFPNPLRKHFMNLSHDIHTRQLKPGEGLYTLGMGFAEQFSNHLVLESLTNAKVSREDASATSLSRLCSESIVDAAQNVYFGPHLSQHNPGLTRVFMNFDDQGWQLLFNLPRFLSPTTHSLKDEIVDAFVDYMKTPRDQRAGGAWSIGVLEGEMRQLGLSNREMAGMLMIFYWG